jgi:PAS domain S-box-containing protein
MSDGREQPADVERPSWQGVRATKLLARVAAKIARAVEIESSIAAILDEAIATFGAKAAHLHLADAARSGQLELAGHRNIPEDLRARIASIGVDATLLATRAARTGRIEQVDPTAAANDPSLAIAREVLARTDARALVSIPLVAHSQLMGVLTCALPRPPTGAETGFVEAVAEIFALGLANAMTFQRERQLRARFDAVREASLAMAEAADVPTVLQQIVDRARAIAGARYAALGIASPQGVTFDPFVFSGLPPNEVAAIGRLPRPVGLLAPGGEAIRVRDLSRDPRFGGFPPGHPPMTSFMAVPIVSRSGRVGTIYLADKLSTREFDDDDQQVVEVLARHAAVAVENLRARKEALAAEHHFRGVFEHALEAMFVVDSTLRVVDANPAAQELLGVDEIRGHTVPELIGNADPSPAELLGRLIEQGEFTGELRLVRRDGEAREIELAAVSNFVPGLHLGVVRDVTARRRAEAEARRWAEAFAHAKWGVVMGDAEGRRLIAVNRAFAEMHGHTVEELVGMPILDVFAPEVRDEVPERIRRANEEGHYAWETLHVRKDGSVFPVLIDVTTVRDETGPSPLPRGQRAGSHRAKAERRGA